MDLLEELSGLSIIGLYLITQFLIALWAQIFHLVEVRILMFLLNDKIFFNSCLSELIAINRICRNIKREVRGHVLLDDAKASIFTVWAETCTCSCDSYWISRVEFTENLKLLKLRLPEKLESHNVLECID